MRAAPASIAQLAPADTCGRFEPTGEVGARRPLPVDHMAECVHATLDNVR